MRLVRPAGIAALAVLAALLSLAPTNRVFATSGASGASPAIVTFRGEGGPVPPGRLANKLAIVPIRTALFEGENLGMTMIDHITARSVQRRIAEAEAWGADAVVFEIDTPGGEIGAVLDITEAIRGTSLYTIAWTNTEAISGGAVIAIACDELVAHPDTIFGDAGLVTAMASLGDTERAKAASPLIADIVDSARRNGYDEVLLQGLSVLNVRLWEVRNRSTGERYFLSESEYRALFARTPPTGSSPYLGGGVAANARPARQFADRAAREGEGSLQATRDDFRKGAEDITPNMERQILRSMEAMGTAPSTRPDFDNESSDDWEYVRYISAGDSFLTVRSASDLGYLNLATASIDGRSQLLSHTQTGSADVRVFNRSAAEWFVKFMTGTLFGQVLMVVLIVIFLVSLFIELSMPGSGVFGAVALAALTLLILPNIMLGMAGWVLLAALLLGIALILIEIFITPGLGVPGIAGMVLLIVGLVGAISSPGAGGVSADDYAWGGLMVLLALFTAGVCMYLFTRYTNFVPVANKLILNSTTPARDEMLASMGTNELIDDEAKARVGDEGLARTRLMPAGTAEINGELVDAVAERGFIEQGERVRVLSATRYRVSVERIDTAHGGGDSEA